MLLNESISNCIDAIQEKQQAQSRKQSHDNYKSALSALNNTTGQLTSILKCAESLNASEVTSIPPFLSGTRDLLLDSLENCCQELDDRDLNRNTERALSNAVRAAESELDSFWKRAAAVYSAGVIGYLSLIAGFTDNPDQVRTLIRSMQDISSSKIKGSQITALVSNVHKAQSITSSFSLDPQIEYFLKKVSGGYATIADLTPDVIAWLHAKDLTKKLKVRF